MKLLLTGATGQVGSALRTSLSPLGEVLPLRHSDLDLAKPSVIREVVRAVRPDVIVNAAAYTAVDQAESEEAIAFSVNCEAPAILAEEASRLGALLVHFSTDYVFDGEKAAPYVETDVPNPLNAYGRSKLAGEQAIQASACPHLIFRTSWVYSEQGKNFLLTMLRLGRERSALRVVNDQCGAPTTSHMLAGATAAAIRAASADSSLCGLYHATAAGRTTWCEFARAIFQARRIVVSVEAISSADYVTPARRPRNSLLNNLKLEKQFGIRLPAWEVGMQDVLERL